MLNAQFPGQHIGLGAISKPKRHFREDVDAKLTKSPFMLLHEKFPLVNQLTTFIEIPDAVGTSTNTTTTGCRFRCTATLDNRMFIGEGASKKLAKQAMAEHALHELMPTFARSLANMTPVAPTTTYVADVLDGASSTDTSIAINPNEAQQYPSAVETKMIPTVASASSFRDDLMDQLLQCCQEREASENVPHKPKFDFEDISTAGAKPHEKMFRCTLTMLEQGIYYKVEGHSKQALKSQLIKQALVNVFGIVVDSRDEQPRVMTGQPAMLLNELATKHNIKFDVAIDTIDGKPITPHSTFKCIIDIAGRGTFTGEGSSKKMAKAVAARDALRNEFNIIVVDGDDGDSTMPKHRKRHIEMANTKNPVQLLYELCLVQGSDMHVTFEQVDVEQIGRRHMYTIRALVGTHEFFAKATSKKVAKIEAARDALRTLFLFDTMNLPPDTPLYPQLSRIKRVRHEGCADILASLVRHKYLELCNMHQMAPTAHLTGFVFTRGSSLFDGNVVALATGTKALTQASIASDRGLVLIDCHAPVLARRALLQLSMLLADGATASQSIFERNADDAGGGYRLKPDYRLHMYSTAAPNTSPTSMVDDPNETANVLQLLSINDDSGSIVNAEYDQHQQTWKSLIGGGAERLKVMSVADKMLKWNMIGLQGALLSHFLQPIYLSTICFGTHCDIAAVTSAIYGRLAVQSDDGTSTPPPPMIHMVSDADSIQDPPSVVPSLAHTWIADSMSMELIVQETGINLNGKCSSLCKSMLFDEFGRLINSRRLSLTVSPTTSTGMQPSERASSSSSFPPLTNYRTAKDAAVIYQTSMTNLIVRARAGALGEWQRKPPEMEHFNLSWAD